jgi:hypothetical protein
LKQAEDVVQSEEGSEAAVGGQIKYKLRAGDETILELDASFARQSG